MTNNFNLPSIQINQLPQNTWWSDLSYIPFASNIKGVADIVTGVFALVIGSACLVVVSAQIPMSIYKDYSEGNSIFNRVSAPNMHVRMGHYQQNIKAAILVSAIILVGGSYLTRGLVESIPIIGNAAIAFYDRKIQLV